MSFAWLIIFILLLIFWLPVSALGLLIIGNPNSKGPGAFFAFITVLTIMFGPVIGSGYMAFHQT